MPLISQTSHCTEENSYGRKTQILNNLFIFQTGFSGVFDGLVLTMPTPQILQQPGEIAALLEANQDIKFKLQSVQYSSRYALGLFFDETLPELSLGGERGAAAAGRCNQALSLCV